MTPTLALTVDEAAAAAGVSRDAIRAAYRSGALTVRHVGGRIVVRVPDLDAWLEGLPTENTGRRPRP